MSPSLCLYIWRWLFKVWPLPLLYFLLIFFQEDLTEEEKKGNVSIFQVNCNLYIIALQAIKPVYIINEKQELVKLDMYSWTTLQREHLRISWSIHVQLNYVAESALKK